jgi:hypothetical protein
MLTFHKLIAQRGGLLITTLDLINSYPLKTKSRNHQYRFDKIRERQLIEIPIGSKIKQDWQRNTNSYIISSINF